MKAVSFSKYHGIGNDFVVMDERSYPSTTEWVEAICDRHRGVGADGVLLVSEVGQGGSHDARMVIYNRDGSRPEMCGNGIRCVARYLLDRGLLTRDEFVIASDAGPRRCQIVERGVSEWSVRVQMGAAVIDEATVSVNLDGFDGDFVAVDMGNPHAVIFEGADDATADAVGEALNSAHPAFPEGVNVEFVEQLGPSHIRVVVFERGVGRTMACGTGACAAAAAAIDAGLCPADSPVDVELPGGTLRIEMSGDQVWMTGPVEAVFSGELDPAWLRERR